MRTGSTIPPRPKNNINDSLEDILGKAQQDDRNALLADIEKLEKERDDLLGRVRRQHRAIETAQKAFFAADNRALRKALGIGEGT